MEDNKKRKAEDIDDENNGEPLKIARGEESAQEASQVSNKASDDGRPANAETPKPSAASNKDVAVEPLSSSKTKEKLKPKVPEYCGTVLFSGGTNWDLIGRRELPKNVKGVGGRNLWGPHRLKALSGIRVKSIAAGNSGCHSVVITELGKVMTWGRNDKGQLGHGDTKRRDNPTVIDALNGQIAVIAACGRSHTLVLNDSGQVFSFGDNKMGQCGVGSQTSGVLVPSRLSFKGRPIIKVACGGEFSMIIDNKGHLFSFGCPEYGQLGHNTDGKYFVTSNKLAFRCELVPRRVGLFIEKLREGHIIPVDNVQIIDVACGSNHTVAMDTNKHCFTWGFGGYGRLGHAEPKEEMVPRLVKFFDGPNRGVQSVYAGGSYTMVVSELGALYFWGQNKVGGEATMYPKPVLDLTGWKIRDVGCSNRSIVVAADDSVISWGPSPTYGELGYGESKPKSSTTPQEVKPLDNLDVYSVRCGFGHTLYLVRDEKEEERSGIQKLPEFAP